MVARSCALTANGLRGEPEYSIFVHLRSRAFRLLIFLFGSLTAILLGTICASRVRTRLILRSSEVVSVARLQQVVNGPEGRLASVFGGIYYAGSEEGFDFLVIPLGKVTIHSYMVRSSELDIQHRFALTTDQSRWPDITHLFRQSDEVPAVPPDRHSSASPPIN